MVSGSFVCLVPTILEFSLAGQLVLPFQYFLPFCDDATSPGFEINLFCQIFQIYYTSSVLFSNIFLLMSLAYSVTLQCGIIQIQLMKLNYSLCVDSENKTAHTEQLKKILQLHQSLDECINETEAVLCHQQFVDCFMLSFVIVMILFTTSVKFYLPGIPLIITNAIMLFLICSIGAVTQTHLEKLSASFYEVLWYQMSVKDQKLIRLCLMRSQAVERLTAGGVKTLNLNLFITVSL